MAGVNSVGGALPATPPERNGKVSGNTVPAAQEKIGGQVIISDKFLRKVVLSPHPPVCYPPMPVRPDIFNKDPERAARVLIEPVLDASGADRLVAYQRFIAKVKFASTATLKAALKVLDEKELETRHPGGCLMPINPDPDAPGIIRLLRENIQAELRTRPMEPAEEARELIEGVVTKDGADQMEAFVTFTGKLKQATRVVLEETRDQLIDRMANSFDREQRLIYKLMLHAVNKELDDRSLIQPYGSPGIQRPAVAPAPAVPLKLSQEEHGLLRSKLEKASAGVQTVVKSIAGIGE